MLTTAAQTDTRTVIAEPNLIVRAEPKVDGKPINSIPFSSSITVYEEPRLKDTINGNPNEWRLIEYQGTKGYVWGQFLSWRKIPEDLKRKKFRVSYEGSFCGEVNYDPGLTWYGIYETSNSEIFTLEKVKINFKLIEAFPRSQWEAEGFTDGQDYILETSNSKKSVFLIGSKSPLKEGEIVGKSNDQGFLYPEQILDMSLGKLTLAIRAKVEASIDHSDNSIKKQYELEVGRSKYEFGQLQIPNTVQNITSSIPLIEGTGRINALYKNPLVKWYGDIDGDNKIDFLISTRLMQDTGGADAALILFLSSEAEENEFVKKADEYNYYGGCNG